MHSELINILLIFIKNLTLILFFTYRNKKKSFGAKRMTHQIDVLSAQKCSCLSRCVRTRIVVVKSDPSSAVGFPDFLKDNWQKNGCVALRIDCSVLF